jgi:hypothetical protein
VVTDVECEGPAHRAGDSLLTQAYAPKLKVQVTFLCRDVSSSKPDQFSVTR